MSGLIKMGQQQKKILAPPDKNPGSKKQERESIFLISEIEEIILSTLLGSKELYGLEMSNLIEERSKGKIRIKFGSLYPALRRLEMRKLVISHWGEEEPEDRNGARRKYYKITASGEEILQEKINIRNSIGGLGLVTV